MNFKYESCKQAASAGDLDELKKMHQAGYPWDKWTCANAARNGHLDCLKYAHSQGCKWNNFTPYSAAVNGHLDCLKYVCENGCEWNRWTPEIAAKKGKIECFKYCFERWNVPQIFWYNNYDLTKIIDQIDLNDPVWRKLFYIDLTKYPELQNKVEKKKKEIEPIKSASKEVLQNILPLDIIQYCIHPFI